ncbi:MAG: PepSY domain-containing protein, partial [Myxococcales bacterium]|nr:PepSY domain-containing protein [Myxococcales bacterium]
MPFPEHRPIKGPSRRRLTLVIGLSGALAALASALLARQLPMVPVERATLAALAFVPLWSGLSLVGLVLDRGQHRRGRARRSLVQLHRRLGGAMVLLAMLIFGTGVGAVLDRALAGWQRSDLADTFAPVPPVEQQALDAAVAELLRRHPELHQGDLMLSPATDVRPWLQAGFFDAQREFVEVALDPYTGRERARGRGPLWVLSDLHRRLLLPAALGESLLGLVGLGLGLVLLSGLATRRWLRVEARGSSNRRVAPASMRAHQWLGLGLLPAATFWAWSGAMLGLSMIIVPLVGTMAYGG